MQSLKIILSLVSLFFFFVVPLEKVQAQSENSGRPLAIVQRFIPTVTVDNGKDVQSKVLNIETGIGEQLFNGDTLRTDTEGYALVLFLDKSIAKVKPNSLLVILGEDEKESKRTNRRINLERGELFLEIEPQGSNDFEVATSRSTASVKGTKFGGKSEGYYWVEEGQVDVTSTSTGETVSLFQKMFAQVNDEDGILESGTLTDQQIQNLNEGYGTLDQILERKEIRFRFRDENGQLREVIINIIEKGNE